MRFVEIIDKKKFTLISIFLFLYIMLNLFVGQRGIISYFEKKNIIDHLIKEKQELVLHLNSVEKRNSLLTNVIDTDYLEILYRKKFMLGKFNEKIYINEKK